MRCLTVSRATWVLSRPTKPLPLGVPRANHLIPKSPNPGYHRRHVSFDTVSSILLPPTVFGGLLVTLWTYKCLMMITFQNKIIYMPSVPPFSRSEKVSDYENQCRPVHWEEHDLKASDGTALKVLEGSIPRIDYISHQKRVVVLYFQGNASSLPPRLPYLSSIIKSLSIIHSNADGISCSIVALSYRGFWKSKGSASQQGIELDAEAALNWVLSRYDSTNTQIVVWGQSIGAGVASLSVASLTKSQPQELKRISGLLLETPFVDLSAMLLALYPQKFLPYRYLGPFLRSTWDSKTALQVIGEMNSNLQVLLLQAGKDEIVPDGQASILESVGKAQGLKIQRAVVPHTLHTEIMMKSQGRIKIVEFLHSIASRKDS